MSFRRWLAIKILGFDPQIYEKQVQERINEMTAEVANVMEIKNEMIKVINKEVSAISVEIPSNEWFEAVQGAITSIDKRIDYHEECLNYVLSKDTDKKVTVTPEWGLIKNQDNNN